MYCNLLGQFRGVATVPSTEEESKETVPPYKRPRPLVQVRRIYPHCNCARDTMHPSSKMSQLFASTCALTWLLSSMPLASANWRYKSRPDLAPPTLNITIPATSEVEKGYLFMAPFSGYAEGTRHGPLQAAPYIFTDTGDLVWSGFTYFSIWATNFQAAKYKGRDVLFCFEGSHNAAYGHGHGHTTFLDQNYETIRELRAGNHRLTDKHEFHIINEETALIQIYHPVPYDLSPYGGGEQQQWIVDARFQGEWYSHRLERIPVDMKFRTRYRDW